MGRRNIVINIDAIKELYYKNISVDDIAKLGNISKATVYNYLKESDNKASDAVDSLDENLVKQIVELRLQNKTINEISNVTGVTPNVLKSKLDIVLDRTNKVVKIKEFNYKDVVKKEKAELEEMYLDLLYRGYTPKEIIKVYNPSEFYHNVKYYNYSALTNLKNKIKEDKPKRGYHISNLMPICYYKVSGDKNDIVHVGDDLKLVYPNGQSKIVRNVSTRRLASINAKVLMVAKYFFENNNTFNLNKEELEYYKKYDYYVHGKHKYNWEQLYRLSKNNVSLAKAFLLKYGNIYSSFNEYVKCKWSELEAMEQVADSIVTIFDNHAIKEKEFIMETLEEQNKEISTLINEELLDNESQVLSDEKIKVKHKI